MNLDEKLRMMIGKTIIDAGYEDKTLTIAVDDGTFFTVKAEK